MSPACAAVPATREELAAFGERLARLRVPVEGSLALTHRCNLRCAHCYLGGAAGAAADELSTAEVLGIVDQLAEAGTLFLTLTGGEPVLRGDFAEIYRHVVRRGIRVTLFSNGTLLAGEALAAIEEYPPLEIEVTVPGASRDVFEAVTRVPGSHARCLDALRLLRERGLPFSVKTVVMPANAAELDAIEALALDLGAPFRYDTAVFAPFPGPGAGNDTRLAGLRLEPEAIARIDVATPARREAWTRARRRGDGVLWPRRVFLCSAGETSFHVDARGVLTPCVLSVTGRHDLRRGRFLEGWRGAIAAVRALEPGPGYRCAACGDRTLCAGCPAEFELETGAPDRVADWFCRTTRARAAALAAAC